VLRPQNEKSRLGVSGRLLLGLSRTRDLEGALLAIVKLRRAGGFGAFRIDRKAQPWSKEIREA